MQQPREARAVAATRAKGPFATALCRARLQYRRDVDLWPRLGACEARRPSHATHASGALVDAVEHGPGGRRAAPSTRAPAIAPSAIPPDSHRLAVAASLRCRPPLCACWAPCATCTPLLDVLGLYDALVGGAGAHATRRCGCNRLPQPDPHRHLCLDPALRAQSTRPCRTVASSPRLESPLSSGPLSSLVARR